MLLQHNPMHACSDINSAVSSGACSLESMFRITVFESTFKKPLELPTSDLFLLQTNDRCMHSNRTQLAEHFWTTVGPPYPQVWHLWIQLNAGAEPVSGGPPGPPRCDQKYLAETSRRHSEMFGGVL